MPLFRLSLPWNHGNPDACNGFYREHTETPLMELDGDGGDEMSLIAGVAGGCVHW